jgi:hypothetical protein
MTRMGRLNCFDRSTRLKALSWIRTSGLTKIVPERNSEKPLSVSVVRAANPRRSRSAVYEMVLFAIGSALEGHTDGRWADV